MSCFCAVLDMARCCATSQATSSPSSRGKPVRAAEAQRVALSQRRMIAAAPLGHVVEEPAEVEHFLALEVVDEARAERILVRMLRLGEAPQVADDHQDVLVHRVDVEEVVLHLPDDAPERRQVMSEDAVQVHPAQLVRDAARFAEDLDEAGAILRIAAEAGIDPAAVAPERAQRPRRHALQFRMALQREKRVEHRGRAPLEQRLVADVEQLVDGEEVHRRPERERRKRGRAAHAGSAAGSR